MKSWNHAIPADLRRRQKCTFHSVDGGFTSTFFVEIVRQGWTFVYPIFCCSWQSAEQFGRWTVWFLFAVVGLLSTSTYTKQNCQCTNSTCPDLSSFHQPWTHVPRAECPQDKPQLSTWKEKGKKHKQLIPVEWPFPTAQQFVTN